MCQVKKLSNLISDYYFKSIEEGEFYHFTSRESAENIIKSGVFKLSNIKKRFNEGEIKSFCERYKLEGYLQLKNGSPAYRNLIMPNTYFASFVSTNISEQTEQYLWRNFAFSEGVRFKFKIKAARKQLRNILYESNRSTPDLLEEIFNLSKSINKNFVLRGISTLCAYYLTKDYSIENEIRFLYRDWCEHQAYPQFIEVKLGQENSFGLFIDIIEISSNKILNTPNNYSFCQRVNF